MRETPAWDLGGGMWSPSVMSLAHLRRSSGDPSLIDYGAIADPGGPAIEVRGWNPLRGRRRLVAVFTIAFAADFWMRFALVRTQEDQGGEPDAAQWRRICHPCAVTIWSWCCFPSAPE